MKIGIQKEGKEKHFFFHFQRSKHENWNSHPHTLEFLEKQKQKK